MSASVFLGSPPLLIPRGVPSHILSCGVCLLALLPFLFLGGLQVTYYLVMYVLAAQQELK